MILTSDQLVRVCYRLYVDCGMTVDELMEELDSKDCPITYTLDDVKEWLSRMKAKYSK